MEDAAGAVRSITNTYSLGTTVLSLSNDDISSEGRVWAYPWLPLIKKKTKLKRKKDIDKKNKE